MPPQRVALCLICSLPGHGDAECPHLGEHIVKEQRVRFLEDIETRLAPKTPRGCRGGRRGKREMEKKEKEKAANASAEPTGQHRESGLEVEGQRPEASQAANAKQKADATSASKATADASPPSPTLYELKSELADLMVRTNRMKEAINKKMLKADRV